jgi:vacuolar-type H+-ATPase subunit H
LEEEMKKRALVSVSTAALTGFVLVNASSYAHADFWSDNVAPIGHAIDKAKNDAGKTVEKAAQDTGKTVEKAGQDTGKTVEKAAQDTGKTVEKAAQDTGKTVEKAAQDTGKTVEKAAQDTGKTIEKAVQDTGKAGETVYKFGVREIEDIGQMVSDADRRLKEGKIVDARCGTSRLIL